MADSGMDADTAREIVGHKTKEVHLRYRHQSQASAQAAIQKLPLKTGTDPVQYPEHLKSGRWDAERMSVSPSENRRMGMTGFEPARAMPTGS